MIVFRPLLYLFLPFSLISAQSTSFYTAYQRSFAFVTSCPSSQYYDIALLQCSPCPDNAVQKSTGKTTCHAWPNRHLSCEHDWFVKIELNVNAPIIHSIMRLIKAVVHCCASHVRRPTYVCESYFGNHACVVQVRSSDGFGCVVPIAAPTCSTSSQVLCTIEMLQIPIGQVTIALPF